MKPRGSGAEEKLADPLSRPNKAAGSGEQTLIYRDLRDFRKRLAANVYSTKTEYHVTAGGAAAEAEHGSKAREHE